MRFMMLMYPGPQADAHPTVPDEKTIAPMMKFNEDLAKAGVLLSLDGLQPSSKGARITFPHGKAKVSDGPFTEAKEVIGGYWMIQVKSKAEAIEWASKCPVTGPEMIEVRQVFEMSDFGIDPKSDLGAQVERVGAELENKSAKK
jgi:hypothetical protein